MHDHIPVLLTVPPKVSQVSSQFSSKSPMRHLLIEASEFAICDEALPEGEQERLQHQLLDQAPRHQHVE